MWIELWWKQNVSFGMHGMGHLRWRLLLLEMLSTCIYYSQLHWRWFEYVSPCYWIMWPSLVFARFRFLIDHLSGPCCFTYLFSIGTRVVSGWVMCHFFIGLCVVFLLVHLLVLYSTTCHGVVRPCFVFFIWPRGLTASFHMSDFY
jgi:hypothetical protein